MNSLITEISENLPKPSDFGVGNSEYVRWENEILELRKIPEQYDYTYNFIGGLVLVGIVILWITVSWKYSDGWKLIFALIYFGALIAPILPERSIGREYTSEYKKIIEKINELENKKYEVDHKHKTAKNSYIEKALNQYRDTYLYRKRTDSYGFSERLQTYSDAVEHFHASNTHRNYVTSRNIRVVPYKRPSQQVIEQTRMIEQKKSPHLLVEVQETKQSLSTTEEFEMRLEDTKNIPPQQVGHMTNCAYDRSPDSDVLNKKSNMMIGNKGEEVVAYYEKRMLQKNGNNELASKVEIVSKTIGDGLGYDVLSFDQYGNKKFIEVKTTRSNGDISNFTFTRNELNFLINNPNTAFVYCVFDITKNIPRLKIYPAKMFLGKSFEPIEYRVSVH